MACWFQKQVLFKAPNVGFISLAAEIVFTYFHGVTERVCCTNKPYISLVTLALGEGCWHDSSDGRGWTAVSSALGHEKAFLFLPLRLSTRNLDAKVMLIGRTRAATGANLGEF
ncbi:hypothetical protein KIL84_011031 [Mauremys mutica]|uniref:Uncharacterized protein n=1 Tax=Mauremys mutica TaxID=74926 RepID=A0A9D4B1K3_9SAUR|nr:hypothetical protein KIL84_011031 [Mauremys mutica]